MSGGQSLVVMYHYVWPDNVPVPGGIRPLLASEFERQLDWIEERYEIVSADAFLDSLNSESRGKPQCLLTFDDGTSDHAEVVTPILARRGLSGLFFVLTWPMELKRMPLTHAVHWLLGQGEEAILSALEHAAIEETGSVAALGDEAEARKIYHYETPARARIKYAVNMAMPHLMAERIVERCIETSGVSMAELAERWFVSASQVRQMHEAGMTIGLHGCSHRSLQVLGAEGIRQELEHASKYVGGLIGEKPSWFSCPFGGSGAATGAVDAMQMAMRECGIRGSVTTDKSLVPAGCDPWKLPRFDAIDLPPRKTGGLEVSVRAKRSSSSRGETGNEGEVVIRMNRSSDRDRILNFIIEMGFNPRDAVTWDGLGMMAMTAWIGPELIGAIPMEPRRIQIGGGKSIATVHETVVAVHPEWRSKGLGTQLQEAIGEMRPGGAELATVFREEPESPAYRWYRRNGFVSVVHIDSWFADARGDEQWASGFELCGSDDMGARWGVVEEFRRELDGTTRGLVSRADRPLREWLECHPYRGRYSFRFVMEGNGRGYALLGVGKMHSETMRADVLEFCAGDDRLGRGLIRSVWAVAAKNGWQPVRWPLAMGDPSVKLAGEAGFTAKWGFDMLVRPLTDLGRSILEGAGGGGWRYAGVDYA